MASLTEIRFLIEQMRLLSGFNVSSSLKICQRDFGKTVKILKEIVSKLTSDTIDQLSELQILVELICYLFQNLLFAQKTHWIIKDQQVSKLESCLMKFFTCVPLSKRVFVIDTIVKYLDSTNLWHLEYISGRLFRILLLCDFDSEFILTAFVDYIEKLLEVDSFQVAIDALLVFNQILTMEQKWENIHFPDVTHFLRLYHTLTRDSWVSDVSSGFELCLQGLFKVMSMRDLLELVIIMIPLALDVTKTGVSLPFTNLTLDAVNSYMKKGKFSDVPTFLVEYLIDGIASEDANKSYFACKIIARLFDSNGNYNEFLFPRIFHSHMSYNVNPSSTTCGNELSLILTYQRHIYNALLTSVKYHNFHKNNLNVIYTTICTIIVKILPGTEAAAVVCLLMDMQTFFLDTRISKKIKNYGHGLVLSLMSLYCWIYRGKPLVTYVDNLISKRFKEAQHLLPPSAAVQSDEISYKSQPLQKKSLFFDNLELRYALWKCFVTKESIVEVSHSEKSLVKPQKIVKDFQLKLNLTTME